MLGSTDFDWVDLLEVMVEADCSTRGVERGRLVHRSGGRRGFTLQDRRGCDNVAGRDAEFRSYLTRTLGMSEF